MYIITCYNGLEISFKSIIKGIILEHVDDYDIIHTIKNSVQIKLSLSNYEPASFMIYNSNYSIPSLVILVFQNTKIIHLSWHFDETLIKKITTNSLYDFVMEN